MPDPEAGKLNEQSSPPGECGKAARAKSSLKAKEKPSLTLGFLWGTRSVGSWDSGAEGRGGGRVPKKNKVPGV